MGILFNRYGALVYGVCIKYLRDKDKAGDMMIHVFEKLMDQLLEKDIEHFKAWLHVVTKNHCLMLLRKESRSKEYITDTEEMLRTEAAEDAIGDLVLKEEQYQLLDDALKALKPEQEECIRRFYIKEQCYKEIANQTGYNLKQVKSYIQNGKRNLKNSLMQHPEFTTTK